MKHITVIGSHGYDGRYGGWDQLVLNLVEKKSSNISLRIINPRGNSRFPFVDNVFVIFSFLKGTGLQGLLLDFYSCLRFGFSSDTLLLLGAKGIPAAIFSSFFFGTKIVVNVGGIEWERPQYSAFIKVYLRLCFNLTLKFAHVVILDNESYLSFVPVKFHHKVKIIPYGGFIDHSISVEQLLDKYNFLSSPYFLSVSRSIPDNNILELCNVFHRNIGRQLVLISNFSSSKYGRSIYDEFHMCNNITLIDGLYDKKILDCIRLNALAYIHTHSLCGSAPSLIEMIVTMVPIISIDNPQNRFTLKGEGEFFQSFDDLDNIINCEKFTSHSVGLSKIYSWHSIISQYEDQF